VVTGSWWVAILCTLLYQFAVLFVADKTAPMVSKFYGLEGISLPTGSTAAFAPIGILVGMVVSRIPGIKNLHADPDSIQKRFGIFGEPMMMGLILGCVIGLLAGYGPGDIFQTGISLGAVMLLLPRMVKILMEGLIPISESARTFLQKRYGDRDLYIGLDAALAVGHPSVLSTALILVPISLLLAVILPGNRVLPFGDLATIPFYVAFVVGFLRGNIVHSVLAGTVMLAFSLYMATNFAVVHTEMMQGAQFTMPEGATLISSLDMGGNLFNWLILKFSQLLDTVI
jgi:PTS system galactitol-specific IIC component